MSSINFKKPNFLVIGVEKAGTTWLYNKLREHPQIYLPLTKECNFFNSFNSNLEPNDNYQELGWEWYRRFFNKIPDQAKAFGEVTPMYICDHDAPKRIANDLPDVKLIYILRNPIKRAYSHYWMAYRLGRTNMSFEEIVNHKDPRFIKRGRYTEQLNRYYNLFPENNLRGYIYENFFETPAQHLADIHAFINVKMQHLQKDKLNNKIHASAKPRSKFLFNSISKVAKLLRKNNLTFGMLDYLKGVGIAEKIKDWNEYSEQYPPIKKNLFFKLLTYYEGDFHTLENEFGLNIDHWKSFSK